MRQTAVYRYRTVRQSVSEARKEERGKTNQDVFLFMVSKELIIIYIVLFLLFFGEYRVVYFSACPHH
jgi:hypothetical protein